MRLNIRNKVVTDLSYVADEIGLNKKTIINLAIYHGIEAIYKGYVPKIKAKSKEQFEKESRTKILIAITEEMNADLEQAIYYYLYKKELAYDEIKKNKDIKKRVKTMIVEKFIEIEVQKLRRLCFEDDIDLEKEHEINVRINVPSGLIEKLMELEDKLDISKNQLQKYFFLSGYQDSENNISPLILRNDEELVDYIKSLNIDIVKGIALVDYVLRLKYR